MKRLLFTALALVGLLAAPLRAELKYTMRIEAHPSTAQAPALANPLMGMIGGIIVGAIAPAGGLEMTVTVGDKGTRVDYRQAYTIVPAGGSTLMRPDGAMVVINPTTRTYWKMAKPDLSALGGLGSPKVTMTRTGEFLTVAGVRAERARFELRMPIPAPPGASLPAGVPSEIVLDGEMWVSAQYQSYSKMAAGLLGGVNALGVETMAAEGFLMRSLLRSEMFGDQEIESVVTAIGEGPVPASVFDIPAGFTEVPPPTGLPMMRGAQ